MCETDVDLMDDKDAEFYGCFSPRATPLRRRLSALPSVEKVFVITLALVLSCIF